MADAPKRKKLEKTITEPAKPTNTQKHYCCRCGCAFSRQKGYFPVSHSPMYRGSGYLPWCSDCIEEMYDDYRAKLGSDRDAMRRMCMKMDLYWSENIYGMVERTAGTNSRIRNYIGKTNIIRYIDKTFDDTLKEEALLAANAPPPSYSEENNITESIEEVSEAIEIPEEIIEFWGGGFTPDFYLELDKRYKYWTKDLGSLDPGEVAIYKQICILEVTINRDTQLGKATDKSVNAYNSLLGSANLKPAQKKAENGDQAAESTPFGVWIRRFENDYPIPDPDPDFKDADGIVRYIETWFKGHLSKMVGSKNSYSKIYEDTIAKLRVEHPEFDDEDDDETVFNEIFSQDMDDEDY